MTPAAKKINTRIKWQMLNSLCIVSPYFNRPDFIPIQFRLYKKHLLDPFTLVIVDDADDKHISAQIQEECGKLHPQAIYVKAPTSMNVDHQPSLCAARIVNFCVQRFLVEQTSQVVCIIDADMFLIRPFSILECMENYDLVGRQQVRGPIQYVANGLLFFKTHAPCDWSKINFQPATIHSNVTDTGGSTYYFLQKHPELRCHFYTDLPLPEAPCAACFSDPRFFCLSNFSKTDRYPMELHLESRFLHYRAASNWNQMDPAYHLSKTYMLHQFLVWKKHIVSFCLYNKRPKDTLNAIINCMLCPYIYPNWTCRFYVDSTVPSGILTLLHTFPHVEVVNMPRHDDKTNHGMFWRFLPASDETTKVMISRDADSWLSSREAACVSAWLGTTGAAAPQVHIIRDHCYHSQKMMGGIWGCTTGGIFAPMKQWIHAHTQSNESSYDQKFLADVAYPLALKEKTLMVHYGHPQFDNKGQPVQGYFDDDAVPIPDYDEVSEPVPGLSFVEVHKQNQFACAHCQTVHRTYIGAILEHIPDPALDVLKQYAEKHHVLWKDCF